MVRTTPWRLWRRHPSGSATATRSSPRWSNGFLPGGALVDIGGGNGGVALRLQAAGVEVILVEPGPAGARHAARRGVETVICSTLETAGFPEHSIPAAGLFDVLEHIEDDVAFLGGLREHMKSDGRLYLTVPAGQRLWSGEDDYAGHHRRYSEASLRAVLGQAGFRAEYSSYCFSLLPAPIFLMRALPSRMGLGRDAAPSRADFERDHLAGGGLLARLLEQALSIELRRIASGGRVPAGSSCLVVARA